MVGKSIYLNMRGDYYNRSFSPEEYKRQLELITKKTSGYLYAGKKGFKVVGLAAKVWQVVRSWFGLTNHTNIYRVNSQLLKFLYYGQTHGFLENEEILNLVAKLKKSQKGKGIGNTVHQVAEQLWKKGDLHQVHLIITQYHGTHSSKLKPSWGLRLFIKKPPILNRPCLETSIFN